MSAIDSLYFGGPSVEGLRHVVLFGKFGSGKTSIFQAMSKNAEKTANINGSNISICNLGVNGKAILVDTAGISRTDELYEEKNRQLHDIVRRADIAIYCADIQHFDREAYEHDRKWLEENEIPYLLIFTKSDIAYVGDIARFKREFPQALFLSALAPDAIALLRARLGGLVRTLLQGEPPLLPPDMTKPGDNVVFVFPNNDLDTVTEAGPLLRDLMSRGVRSIATRESELAATLEDLNHVEMIVVHARSFAKIKKEIPDNVLLTCYSMLEARQKGNLETFAEGARAIEQLNEQSEVLIVDSGHPQSIQYDIGRVKIPRELRRRFGEKLQISYMEGIDLPENIGKYSLVIHGGTNILSKRSLTAHIAVCGEAGVPVANFGTVLAELAGVLERCMHDLGMQ